MVEGQVGARALHELDHCGRQVSATGGVATLDDGSTRRAPGCSSKQFTNRGRAFDRNSRLAAAVPQSHQTTKTPIAVRNVSLDRCGTVGGAPILSRLSESGLRNSGAPASIGIKKFIHIEHQ